MQLNSFEAKLASKLLYAEIENTRLETENEALKQKLADLQGNKNLQNKKK